MRTALSLAVLNILLVASVFGQDVCVRCQDGRVFICRDKGQFLCGLENSGCTVANDTTGCPADAKPEDVTLDEKAIRSIKWSIDHQGAWIWDGDKLLSGRKLLNAVTAPMGPGSDRDRVAASYTLNHDNLAPQTVEALSRSRGEFPFEDMKKHMSYACSQGYGGTILHKLQIGDIDGIRHEFFVAEANDDRVKASIYAYDASEVRTLVKGYCH